MANENENEKQQHFLGAHDFVFTKNNNENGENVFVGGGYKVESFFLNNNMAPMTTMNNHHQQGGNTKVSSQFDNLAVPAGLFFINQKNTKKSVYNDKNNKDNYKPHETASDDLIDKLFGLVEVDKKRKRKTKKHLDKVPNKKTRGKK
jgi:hypothetical protein